MKCIRICFVLISMLCLVSCPATPKSGILNLSGGDVKVSCGNKEVVLADMEEIYLRGKMGVRIHRGHLRSDIINLLNIHIIDMSIEANRRFVQESILYNNDGNAMILKVIIKPDMNIYAGFSLKDDSGGEIHIYRHQPFGFPMRLK